MVVYRGHLCSVLVASILMIPILTAIGYDVAPSVSAQQNCDELLENGIMDTSTIENFQLTGDGMNSIDEDEDDDSVDGMEVLGDMIKAQHKAKKEQQKAEKKAE